MAPTFVQTPERLQDVMESSKAGLLRGGREDWAVQTQLGRGLLPRLRGLFTKKQPSTNWHDDVISPPSSQELEENTAGSSPGLFPMLAFWEDESWPASFSSPGATGISGDQELGWKFWALHPLTA